MTLRAVHDHGPSPVVNPPESGVVAITDAREAVILVVDGEPLFRMASYRALGRLAAVEVHCAGSLTEARMILQKLRPHLIVSDLVLEDGSGLDLQVHDIPMLFLAADTTRCPPSIEAIEKPLPIARLRERIAERLYQLAVANEV